MLNKFAGDLRSGRRYKLAKLRQRLFNIQMRDTSGLRSLCCGAARQYGAGRHVNIAIGARTVAKLQSYQECALWPVTTSRDPGRRFSSETAGTRPRNELVLRFCGTAFAFRCCVRAALTVVAQAFGHHHGRNGVFEDELFLIVGFKDD